jgi:hypothetical protein
MRGSGTAEREAEVNAECCVVDDALLTQRRKTLPDDSSDMSLDSVVSVDIDPRSRTEVDGGINASPMRIGSVGI